MPSVTALALRVMTGAGAGRLILLHDDVTIGRDGGPGALSFDDDAEMSRRHARFRPLPSGAVLVEDLGSSNGTDVNGQPIEIPRLLELGDEIRVGGTTLRLEAVAQAPSAPGGRSTVVMPTGTRTPSGPAEDPMATLPPPPVVPAGGGGPVSDRPQRSVVVPVALAVFLVAAVVGAFTWGRQGRRSAPTGEDPGRMGTVYLESGVARPDANAIIAYRYREGGNLLPLAIEEFPTGGAAGFDLTNTGALDADGQVVTSADGRFLFAVNQGSDTVAGFRILSGGSLATVAGSPFPSGGMAPGGLAVSGNRLVVVNKAQDGVRDLKLVAPNVATFIIQPDGSLRATGSVVPAQPGTSPTEALVSPDGQVVVVPEEHGPFLSLTLSAGGKLGTAPGSPVALPDAIFPPTVPHSQRWALGLGAHPNGTVFYGQAVDTAQLVVYQYNPSGQLHFVGAVADPGAVLPCWSLVNSAGTRLYTDNAGNNTMSVFDLSDPLKPRQLQVVAVKDAGNPWDLRMDPSGRFLFVLDARDRGDLVPPGGGNELHTLLVNPDGTLTEPEYSPVPIPVPLNTNPIGLAVVGR